MIAGMRPCLNWSRVEPITIEYARHSDKAGLLAYLIHRVNESKPSSDMTFNEMMDRNQRRIKSYRVISELVEQVDRSEEHTSELQSLMRISYAVFCLKKKKKKKKNITR